jgi:hypothetical protein
MSVREHHWDILRQDRRRATRPPAARCSTTRCQPQERMHADGLDAGAAASGTPAR